MPAIADWVILAFYGVVLTVQAVACHRLVLLGPTAPTLTPALRWGARESKFLSWLLVLGVIHAVVHLAVVLLILNLGGVAILDQDDVRAHEFVQPG